MSRRTFGIGQETTEADLGSAGAAYDALAHRYDALQLENPVLAHAARVSFKLVQSAMANCSYVLDIGCGTGREALELAAMGKRIVACDPSRRSLAVLAEKAEQRGLSQSIRTVAVAASHIDALLEDHASHAFDGAYASFSLSYESTLEPIPEKVWSLLRPGAPFLCSLYNRLCLMEILFMAPFLVPRRALKRLEGATPLPVDQFRVTIHSSTPSSVQRVFRRRFVLEGEWGVPSIVPPNYLHHLVRLAGPLRTPWEELDIRVHGRWPFKHLGSHTAYLFRSRPETSS